MAAILSVALFCVKGTQSIYYDTSKENRASVTVNNNLSSDQEKAGNIVLGNQECDDRLLMTEIDSQTADHSSQHSVQNQKTKQKQSQINQEKEADYTYDLLGRLTKVSYSDGRTAVYQYDPNGNILTIKQTESGGAVIQSPSAVPTESPKSTATNRPKSTPTSSPKASVSPTTNVPMDTITIPAFKKAKPKISVKKGKATKNKVKLNIQLTKFNQATGYQIVYAQNKAFSKMKKVTGTITNKKQTVSITLVKGKTYYIKSRGYCYSSKKKVYTKYSKVCKAKA